MFTGIIEEVGRIAKVNKQGQAMVLTIEAQTILEDIHLGDSISVNGVCLTVIAYHSNSFTVDVMPETFRQTSLKHLTGGSKVNLERAMSGSGRFGGHYVQGHVDTTGTIRSIQQEENAVVYSFEPIDAGVMKYIIPRGSVTLDGISLTVVTVSEGGFSVSIIPHTLAQTVLQAKKVGDSINIEADLLGKYVDHLLNYKEHSGTRDKVGRISEGFLAEHGFA
ncbi:MAG TPA: riboflavin synthase [Bacilli bacterium]